MKQVAIADSPKAETAFNRILRFMTEGDVTLIATEEEIMKRWIFCDKLIMQRKFTEEQIVEKISELYDVSKFTARNDIYKTHALMGGMIKANKKYLLHHHAENILLKIEQFSRDKSLVHLVPKMLEAYTKAVIAIPDEINKDRKPPPIMNFFVIPGQTVSSSKDFDDAIASMNKRQGKLEATDIEHEDLSNETE